ncbi:MAG: PKD domain-containing protein [Opitutales bacterium]|nr:PKD domain-containing protein [Opitutales bacterium]
MSITPLTRILKFLPLALWALFVAVATAGLWADQARGLWISEERLPVLRQLVEEPGTHHFRAFEAMKAHLLATEEAVIEVPSRLGDNWNNPRADYAQLAALASLLSSEPAEKADWALLSYRALRAIYDDPDSGGNQMLGSAQHLNKAGVGFGFALAYEWAYGEWNEAQRGWVRGKVIEALNAWPNLSHPNFGGAGASNWLGVVRGAEMVMLLVMGEETVRPERYTFLRSALLRNAGTHGPRGWAQEGNFYLAYGQTFLLPALIAASNAGDPTMKLALSNAQHHFVPLYGSMFSTGFDAVNWGVGGGIWDAGFAALSMGIAPEGEKGYMRRWFDRFKGVDNPAPDANKFELGRNGRAWALIFYPEEHEARDPGEYYPLAIEDTGGFFMRSGWEDQNDVLVFLGTDRAAYSPGWDAPDALSLVVLANGQRYINGPGNTAFQAAAKNLFSSILVNNTLPSIGRTGGREDFLTHDKGAYAIASGGTAYGDLGLSAARRHLLSDFSGASGARGLLGVFDQLRSSSGTKEYRWQLNTAQVNVAIEARDGRPSFTLTDESDPGGYLRGWVVHPAAANLRLEGGRLYFTTTGEDADIWVVMAVGRGETGDVEITGSGLESVFQLNGVALSYDAGTQRLVHSEMTFTQPPVAKINSSVSGGALPLVVNFDGSASTAPDGLVAYEWDFGDGTKATGAVVAHEYTEPGLYAVTLRVEDAAGRREIAQKMIAAGERWPTASFTITPSRGQPPLLVTFDPGNSQHPDGLALTYEWDLGDGTVFNTTSGASFTHEYSSGSYAAKLVVRDENGGFATANASVEAENATPVARLAWSVGGGQAPLPVQFSAAESSDSDGDPLTFLWDFGDGHTSTEMEPLHVYQTAGNYHVTVTVSDDLGASHTAGMPGLITVLDGSNLVTAQDESLRASLLHGLAYTDHHNPSSSIDLAFDPFLLPVLRESVFDNFYIWNRNLNSQFVYNFTGFIDIPEDGVYTFYFTADQGGELRVAGELIYQRYSTGPFSGWRSVALKAGLHRISSIYFFRNPTSGANLPVLDVNWSGPGFGIRQIDQDKLFWQPGRPVVDFVASPAPDTGLNPVTYNFDAGKSRTFDGDVITDYRWRFPDGSQQFGQTASKTFPTGDHLVTLTVTTQSGFEARTGQTISVVAATDYEQAGGRNRSQMPGLVVTARGSFPNAEIENAFDGDILTRWLDLSLTSWIDMAFLHNGVPQRYVISEYRFTSLRAHNERDPISWNFYGSNDGLNWDLLDEVRDNDFGTGKHPRINHFSIPHTTAYSHYRFAEFTPTAAIGDLPGIGLNEIELIDYGWGNQPVSTEPVPALSVSTGTPAVEEVVVYDGSGTVDPEGYPLYFHWDFGDGQTAQGWELSVAEHVYYEVGTYAVTMTVTDGLGDAASLATSVVVSVEPNLNPVAFYTVSSDTGLEGYTTLTLDASGSSDPDGDTLSYEWDLGNGFKASGPIVTYKLNGGLYSPLLTVRDGKGGVDFYAETIHIREEVDRPRMVGINFAGLRGRFNDTLGERQIAGYRAQAYWNNVTDSHPPFLFDADGNELPMGLRMGNKYSTATPPLTADHRLAQIGSGGPIEVTDIPFSSYAVYVYHSARRETNDRDISWAMRLYSGGETQVRHIRQEAFEWNGVYGVSEAMTAPAAVDGNNIVIFSGLTDRTFTLNSTSNNNNTLAHAIQIVDTSGGANASPIAVIDRPYEPLLLEEGEPLLLAGRGVDIEDGLLPGASLLWESNIDGFLGTGSQLTVSDLLVGVHRISLTVFDSEGAHGMRSFEVIVEGDPAAVGQPTNLRAEPLGTFAVALSWDAVEGVIDGYRLERRMRGSSSWVVIADVSGLSYLDDDLEEATSYDYRLAAYQSDLTGTFAAVSAHTRARPESGILVRYSFVDEPGTGDILVNAGQQGRAAASFVADGILAGPFRYSGRPNASANNATGIFVSQPGQTYLVAQTRKSIDGHAWAFDVSNAGASPVPLAGLSFLVGSSNSSQAVTWLVDTDLGDASLLHPGGTPTPDSGFSRLGPVAPITGDGTVMVEFPEGTVVQPGTTWRFVLSYTGLPHSAYVNNLVLTTDASAPVVAIVSPADGSWAHTGQSISLVGTAEDEDGPLPASALVWESSLDGILGTGSSLVLDNMSIGRHRLSLTATNAANRSITAFADFDIFGEASAPVVITQPADTSSYETATVSLSVEAVGSPPLFEYTWRKGGQDLVADSRISGVDTAVLRVENLTFADAGEYDVVVRNAEGLVVSEKAQLTVGELIAPAFVSHPAGGVFDAGGPISLSVAVTGSSPMQFQWERNGEPLADDGRILGSTTAHLQISGAGTADAGDYRVIVTNLGGSETSFEGTVEINQAPVIQIVRPVEGVGGIPLSVGAWLSAAVFDDRSAPHELTFEWTVESGPGVASITNPGNTETGMEFSHGGEYVIRFAASDGRLTSQRTVYLTVYEDLAGIEEPAGDPYIKDRFEWGSADFVKDDALPPGTGWSIGTGNFSYKAGLNGEWSGSGINPYGFSPGDSEGGAIHGRVSAKPRRGIQRNFDAQLTGERWISLLVRLNEGWDAPGKAAIFALGNDSVYSWGGPRAQGGFGFLHDGEGLRLAAFDSVTPVAQTIPVETDQWYLILAKIEVDLTGPDKMALWLRTADDSFGSTESSLGPPDLEYGAFDWGAGIVKIWVGADIGDGSLVSFHVDDLIISSTGGDAGLRQVLSDEDNALPVGPEISLDVPASAEAGVPVAITASVDDPDNGPEPTTVFWQLVGGAGGAVVSDPFNTSTHISFPAAGSYWLRLIADDGAVATYAETFVSVGTGAVPGTFADWMAGYSADIPAERRAPAFDHSGNGVSNLMSYALHLDPRSPGLLEERLTAAANTADSGWHFRLLMPEGMERADVRYRVEASADLQGWQAVAESIAGEAFQVVPGQPVSITREGQWVIIENSEVGDPAQFLRLSVELMP